MSQAEELLNAVTSDDNFDLGGGSVSEYPGVDAVTEEQHIVIGDDRYITVPEMLKRIAVQYDHNIETVTFDCPRYWDGYDMSVMKVYINYLLSNGEKSSYHSDTVTVDETDTNMMHFTWTISRNVTKVKGKITFLVCIVKVNDDGNEENHWNSELNSDMYVSEGLECPNQIIIDYPDIITQLLTRIDQVEILAADKIYYSISENEINVVTKYNTSQDIVFKLNKHGYNNIFDFYGLSTIENTNDYPSRDISNATSFIVFGTDIHSPFFVRAINNADGDGTATNFTGGNHAYGGVASGRTTVIRFFIDGKEKVDGGGYCSNVEIRWTNLVQAANTFKADGTGREVLQENHRLIFDGIEWRTDVEVIPLEDVTMVTWYGLQIFGVNSIYTNIIYVGGENRAINNAINVTNCGNNTATKVIVYGDKHKCEVEVDPTYDLGNRSMYEGTQGIFSSTYGKIYFYIIRNQTLTANSLYALRGTYRFLPV